MENQVNASNQNTQQIGQNPIGQPVITPEKPKTNYLLIGGVVLACFVIFGFGGYFLGKQSFTSKNQNEQQSTSPYKTSVSDKTSPAVSPSLSVDQDIFKEYPRLNSLIFSKDVTFSKINSNSISLTNKRMKFTFRFNPNKKYVLECPNVNQYNDNTPYFIFELTEQPVQTDCGFGGGQAQVYVSLKQYFDDSSKQPTYELIKKQLLSEGNDYRIISEDPITISGVIGVRVKASRDANKPAPIPTTIDELYFEYNNALYTLSPEVLGAEYQFAFLR